jgi:hypothetical protein
MALPPKRLLFDKEGRHNKDLAAVTGHAIIAALCSFGWEVRGGCSSVVEHWIVAPVVAGSSPVSHPK